MMSIKLKLQFGVVYSMFVIEKNQFTLKGIV